MKNNKEKALGNFVDEETQEEKKQKQEVLHERSGLIERVDKILVTKDGKQLLREQY